jgi:hypothetical protein
VTGDDVFGAFAPLSLGVLTETAGMLTRIDRKYIVDHDVVRGLAAHWSDTLAVLEIDGRRSFAYSSVYFDTDDLALHRAAATHRRHRFKVRTRTYSDSGITMLEVKVKDGRGRTVKHRIDHDPDRASELTDTGAAFVAELTGDGAIVERLRPSLTTEYRRSTVVDLAAGMRATVDHGLVCTAPDGRSVTFDPVIIETKSGQAASEIDRWLWHQHIRPTRISKYCTALAVLHPGLPDNTWHRTIARHFHPAA